MHSWLRLLAMTLAVLVFGATVRAQTSAAKVYMVTLAGEVGRDVAYGPMVRVLRDALNEQPDLLLLKLDCTYMPGEHSERRAHLDASNQLELARRLDELLTDDIRKNERWTTKPRLVFWIKNAHGGAGLLAFISPEIYYTSDGRHSAPDMTGQDGKARSLSLGRAQGIAVKGGHSTELVTSMVRPDFVFSVDFVDGMPRFREDAAGDLVLSEGKERLTFNAALAKRVGLSRRTADSNEEMFRLLQVDPDRATLVGEGDKILARWRSVVTEAEDCVKHIRDKEAKDYPAPEGTYAQRTVARHKERAAHAGALNRLEDSGVALSASMLGHRVYELVQTIRRGIARLDDDQSKDVDERKR